MHRTTAALLCLVLAGCAQSSREQLAKEVLKADPNFSAVLEKHRELANRLETYERELTLKRTTVERSIAQLRKDLADAAANVKVKALDAKRKLEPERERLVLALAMASEELRAKRLQRASLGRGIAKLKKALGSAKDIWTKDERARQDTQIQEMLRDAARLDQEMAALKQHVRLLKIKLLLIRL